MHSFPHFLPIMSPLNRVKFSRIEKFPTEILLHVSIYVQRTNARLTVFSLSFFFYVPSFVFFPLDLLSFSISLNYFFFSHYFYFSHYFRAYSLISSSEKPQHRKNQIRRFHRNCEEFLFLWDKKNVPMQKMRLFNANTRMRLTFLFCIV